MSFPSCAVSCRLASAGHNHLHVSVIRRYAQRNFGDSSRVSRPLSVSFFCTKRNEGSDCFTMSCEQFSVVDTLCLTADRVSGSKMYSCNANHLCLEWYSSVDGLGIFRRLIHSSCGRLGDRILLTSAQEPFKSDLLSVRLPYMPAKIPRRAQETCSS